MNIKLLEKLDFAGIISKTTPVTETGRELIKNFGGYLYSNESNYALVNNFITEARKHSYDPGIMEALQKVASFVEKNRTSWKLASVCETLTQKRPAYDAISKNAISQVDQLLENKNEAEVRQYIKAGALKNIQYIPEFRVICKEVYSESIKECETPSYSLRAPISYCHKGKKGNYFQVEKKVYMNNDGIVTEAKAPETSKFSRINETLSYMTKEADYLKYRYENRGINFTISESAIHIETKGGQKETFNESQAFNEWRDMYVRGVMGMKAKTEFMQVTERLGEVFANFDRIAKCDSVRILETAKGDKLFIVEGKNHVIVDTLAGKNGKSFKNYPTMAEALKNIESATGVNLQTVYEARIVKEAKIAEDKEMQQTLEELHEEKLQIRRKRIERLTEQYKDNPAKLAVINKVAKELSKL